MTVEQVILVTLVFALGVANFALHAAVHDCNHPLVVDMKRHVSQRTGYVLEFIVLFVAMFAAYDDMILGPALYAVYTSFNSIATWMLLTGRA